MMGEKPGSVREIRQVVCTATALVFAGESAKEGIIEWQGPAVGITAGASQFAQHGVS